jgi:hypothetical protein
MCDPNAPLSLLLSEAEQRVAELKGKKDHQIGIELNQSRKKKEDPKLEQGTVDQDIDDVGGY